MRVWSGAGGRWLRQVSSALGLVHGPVLGWVLCMIMAGWLVLGRSAQMLCPAEPCLAVSAERRRPQ